MAIEHVDRPAPLSPKGSTPQTPGSFLRPIPPSLETKATGHFIGNGHLDREWLWTSREARLEFFHTVRSALERMNEYPDFKFTASSASFFRDVEEFDPQLFEVIRARIAEGRFNIVGGSWIEPDMNLVSGESLVRQLMLGQRYFKEKFGIESTTGFNPDAFGHAGSVPQIYQRAGMDAYAFMRPGTGEQFHEIPNGVFLWESNDGSSLLAKRIDFEYTVSGPGKVEEHTRRILSKTREPNRHAAIYYGVGNHGGGPTIQNIEAIRSMQQDHPDARLIFSTTDGYFDSIKEAIADGILKPPTFHGEMQAHAPGCYAADSEIKLLNREAETKLLTAERLSILANTLVGKTYPLDNLHTASIKIADSQFHDSLAGTTIPAAAREIKHRFSEAISMSERSIDDSLIAIANNIYIKKEIGTLPVVVTNPHPWQAKELVEMETSGWRDNSVLIDNEGTIIPTQVVTSEAVVPWRKRIAFMADMPSLGYKVFRIVPGPEQLIQDPEQLLPHVIENKRLRLEIDPTTGQIKNLLDKLHNREIFRGNAAVPVVMEDLTDTWGHTEYRFDNQIGTFETTDTPKLIEHGPVKSVIRVKSTYGDSSLIQDFTLYQDVDRVDVNVRLDWQEKQKIVKLQFPVELEHRENIFEAPYGFVARGEDGKEVPMQSWLDVSGVAKDNKPYGLSFLNTGKYSADIYKRRVSLTIARSPVAAHHLPGVVEEGKDYQHLDQGIQEFTYSLVPHDGNLEHAHTSRQAAELNQPALSLITSFNGNGTLPQEDSFLSVDCDHVDVAVVKQTEDKDSDDMIVRLIERADRDAIVKVHIKGRAKPIEVHMGHSQLVTLRIPRDEQLPYHETLVTELIS